MANYKLNRMENRYSKITIRENQEQKTVQIGSTLKPEIVASIINKWQYLIDTVAKIVNVPSGLIMRLNEDSIEVFMKSQTKGNPYEVGEEAKLIYGLYCETVIGTQKQLLVPDATKNVIWNKNNPDVDINMISYLGFPINWPDGEVFGTVCLLDNKENYFNQNFTDLLQTAKTFIETDLRLMVSNQKLENQNIQLNKTNEIKSKFLSLISHDIRGAIGTLTEFLKLILTELDNFDKNKLKKSLMSLSKSADYTYSTLENLLSWSKNEMLLLEANKANINIVNVLNRVINYYQQTIELKQLNILTDFYSNTVLACVDEKMIETALRNIISNSVKYNYPGGKIFIRLHKRENKNIIEIEDTGIGMSHDTISNLFRYDNQHKSKGTGGESSAGIGLILAKEFLDKNDATVSIVSEIGKGTKFEIQIKGHNNV